MKMLGKPPISSAVTLEKETHSEPASKVANTTAASVPSAPARKVKKRLKKSNAFSEHSGFHTFRKSVTSTAPTEFIPASIVDIDAATMPMISNPRIPAGRLSTMNCGNAESGASVGSNNPGFW